MKIVEITDVQGRLISPDWLLRSEAVHRQLRPHLPQEYKETMTRVFEDGARMLVATNESFAVGVAVYRIYENTALGRHMYVDDLVTDEGQRSSGVGHALLDRLSFIAQENGCKRVTLDSGTQRQRAHKFYFREGFLITSFHFHKQLSQNERN